MEFSSYPAQGVKGPTFGNVVPEQIKLWCEVAHLRTPRLGHKDQESKNRTLFNRGSPQKFGFVANSGIIHSSVHTSPG